MRLFILFSVLISLNFDGCVSEKHVLFIYDTIDTTVHQKDHLLKSVKKVATQIFDTESDFNFKIIHPYESNIVEITKSVNGISPSISNLQNDFHTKRPSTLKNLLKWLRESPSNSVIYVITDVIHPSDKFLVTQILEIIQVKRTEVNFIVKSQHLRNHILEDYRSISFVSNGFVQFNWTMEYFDFHIEHLPNSLQYHISKQKVNQFAELVYLGLKYTSQKIPLISIDHLDKGFYCFRLDSLMTELTAMIHANYEEYSPNYSFLRNYVQKMTSGIFNKECISIDIVQKSWHTISRNPSIYSLRVIARSDFNFNYGFSTDPVDSLDETYIRPIKGKSNLIYISSNNKTLQAEFHFLDIILRNGTSLGMKNLQRVGHDTNLFAGRFEPPDEEYFHIRVLALVNGEYVMRMSNAMNAANGFGKDENNPMLGPNYIRMETYLLIVISLCIMVILGEIVWYIKFFKKTPELPPFELEKSHPRAVSNIYHPVSYKVQNQKVELV